MTSHTKVRERNHASKRHPKNGKLHISPAGDALNKNIITETVESPRRVKPKKKVKEPNFSKYIYDNSPGCYWTNYLITATNLYYAMKYFYRYSDLKEYPEQTEYLLNKQMLCQFCIIYNLFCGLATLFCGLVHHFFYDEKKLSSSVFWSLGSCMLGICVLFNGLFPLFLIYEITSVLQYRVIMTLTFVAAVSLGVEEMIWEKVTYGICSLGAIVVCGAICLCISFIPDILLDHAMLFDESLLYTGMAVMLAYTLYYLKIQDNCRVPYAFSNKMCPFPDQFNHNAVLHVVTMFCYWAINKSFLMCL